MARAFFRIGVKTQFFRDKSVLVTGGGGFLGKPVVRRLQQADCRQIIVPRQKDFDLTREAHVERLFEEFRPDLVIHIAGITGGIEFSRQHPGELFYKNLIMNTLVLEYARRASVKKFIGIGTVCSYPKHAPIPITEEELWNGYPEETNAPYGLAKKMLLVQGQAYRQQYGFNAIHLLCVNLYGPADHFDLETGHVIPSLIVKCLKAIERQETEIVCWGDGTPTREFLYVEDCAEAIVVATERYDGGEPVNIGAGFEISVKELAELIVELTGFKGRILWDTTKPNGQPRRCLDTSRACQEFGWRARTPLREGLQRTIEWLRFR